MRKIIYTTNAIESLNSQVRKSVRSHGHFPSDKAASKLIYLVLQNIEAKWTRPPIAWHQAKAQFAIHFEDMIRDDRLMNWLTHKNSDTLLLCVLYS